MAGTQLRRNCLGTNSLIYGNFDPDHLNRVGLTEFFDERLKGILMRQ